MMHNTDGQSEPVNLVSPAPQSHLNQFREQVSVTGATMELVARSPEAVRDAVLARASAKRPILIAEPRYLSPDYFRPLRSEEGVLRNQNAADYRSPRWRARVPCAWTLTPISRVMSACCRTCTSLWWTLTGLFSGPRIFFASSNLLGPPTTEISSSSAGQAPRRTWVRWSAGSMGRMSFTSWCFAEPCRSR